MVCEKPSLMYDLAAIAARLGRVIKWDPEQEKIVDDEQAAAFFARQPRSGFEIPRVSA